MFKFVLFVVFFTCALGAKLQVSNGANLFQISASYTGAVTWTLNGNTYNHLQQLSPTCPQGGTPISQGNGVWACGPYDTLNALAPNCTAFEVVKFVNGSYVCAPDNDALNHIPLGSCAVGNVAKTNSSGSWTCQADQDLLSTLTCGTSGQVLIYNVNAWECVNANQIPDSNILGQLSCGSSAGGATVVKLLNTTGTPQFACSFDLDYQPTCYNGATLMYNGTQWLCAPDSDTAVNVSNSCSASNPYLKYSSSGWYCSSTYFNLVSKRNVEVFGGEIIVLNALVANIGTNSSGLTKYTATWGNENLVSDSTVAPIMPINGSIYSVRLYLNNFVVPGSGSQNLTLNILVNGTVIGSNSFTVPQGSINARSFLYKLPTAFQFAPSASVTANFNTSIAFPYTSGTVGFNFYLQV